MKELGKLIVVLTLISLAAGLMLAFTNKITTAPIALAAGKTMVDTLAVVLPEFDNQPNANAVTFKEDGVDWTFFVARKGGKYAGCAFVSTSNRGYGGAIKIMAGVTAAGALQRLEILEQQETPGLGTKIKEPAFKDQFNGRNLESTIWKVKKDGGQIDAITGATISSRAVAEAVRTGVAVYRKHAAEIAKVGE